MQKREPFDTVTGYCQVSKHRRNLRQDSSISLPSYARNLLPFRKSLGVVVGLGPSADAELAILGCTELPLVAARIDKILGTVNSVIVPDPTAILARKCVIFSLQNNDQTQ
jgi:hypothetical protein